VLMQGYRSEPLYQRSLFESTVVSWTWLQTGSAGWSLYACALDGIRVHDVAQADLRIYESTFNHLSNKSTQREYEARCAQVLSYWDSQLLIKRHV
jgi:hypothetical protein